MAAKKYLTLVNGVKTLVSALVVSSGAGDEGKIVALDASGKLDNSVMPVGIGADTKSLTASEALSAGNIVNVWNSSGEKARKADASTTGKEGVGFILSSVSSSAAATVYFEGTITGLSSLVPGTRYYLDAATPGLITATAPSGSGQIVQYIGTAISTTELSFEPSEPIEIA
jgi:hypothetical protein